MASSCKPLRFPGGSIGELAVNGTLNDLAVSAARPIALMATLILEAGLPASMLGREIEAMATPRARPAFRSSAATPKSSSTGRADGMYVSTFGIGAVDERATLDPGAIRRRRQGAAFGPDRQSTA